MLYEKINVAYLPQPNRVQFILDTEIMPLDATPTSFMVCLTGNGSVVMAMNARRGLEFSGGHVEPNESVTAAAVREAFEETGCCVSHIKPLGYLKQTSEGDEPQDYRYPWPTSYQQFFVGRVMEITPYAVNDECLEPVVLTLEEARLRLDENRLMILEAALEVFQR